jgi:hypothetical protein
MRTLPDSRFKMLVLDGRIQTTCSRTGRMALFLVPAAYADPVAAVKPEQDRDVFILSADNRRIGFPIPVEFPHGHCNRGL